jgi:asparagine N-glycosylation enzyme membrane subunit Stt3
MGVVVDLDAARTERKRRRVVYLALAAVFLFYVTWSWNK